MLTNILEKNIKIKNLFPFLKWIWTLKKKGVLKTDIIAWISVGLVLVPQSIAYAKLAHLPPIMWLYTAFIPTIIAWLFWSSKQSSTWPTAVVSLLTAAALWNILPDNKEWYIYYVTFMAVIVWVFQLILWFARLWAIIKFFSHPVIRWFTNAAAIIIIASQIPEILWINIEFPPSTHFSVKIIEILKNITQTDLITLLIWMFSLISIIYFKVYRKNIPWTLIVIVITTFISWLIWFDGAIWEIPKGLPKFSIPKVDFAIALKIVTSAIIIWAIGFMEAISIAKTLAIKTDETLDVNQELVGQWLANLSSWLFGGYPVAGSFARSAIANNLNAKTGFTAVVSWLVVWFTLLFLTPILAYVPKVTLWVIIIIAVLKLVKFEPFIKALKVEPHDFIVWIVTFISTLALAPNLEKWILIWVLLSLFLFLYRTMTPRFIEVSKYKDGSLRDAQKFWLSTSKDIWVYRFDGSLYFANSEYFSDKLFRLIDEKSAIKLVILDFECLNDIDLTGMNTLEKAVKRIKNTGVSIYIIRSKLHLKKVFERVGFLEYFWEEKFFYNLKEALRFSLKDVGELDKWALRRYRKKLEEGSS